MSEKEDLALETLRAVRSEIAPDLDEDLLNHCYAIQKRHQFNSDRTQSSMAMERLIDDDVAAVAAREASAS